jgi:hypothetical protein
MNVAKSDVHQFSGFWWFLTLSPKNFKSLARKMRNDQPFAGDCISLLSIDFIDASYASRSPSKVDYALRKKYRKKIDSICYSTNISRPNVTKAAFKLTKYLINSKPDYLHATNHCLRYLHVIKHLTIRYSLSRDDELIVLTSFNFDSNFDLDQYQ